MQIETVPIGDLVEDPGNARVHGTKNRKAIRGSLDEFGQVEPLVVQAGSNRVIGGNGRLAEMRELGVDQVHVVYLEVNDEVARDLAVALNRTGELAEWDFERLAEIVRESEVNFEALGWDADEIETLLEIDWTPPAIEDQAEEAGAPPEDSEAGPMLVTFSAEQWASVLQVIDPLLEPGVDYASAIVQALT